MATITVYRPDTDSDAPRDTFAFAARTPPEGMSGQAVLTIIENGKPQARQLLSLIAAGVRRRLPVATVDVFSKPTAAKPIDADEARMLAARSRLIITGLGD